MGSGGLAPTAIALAERHTCVTRPAQRAGAADRVASDTRPATKPQTYSSGATALGGDYSRKQNFMGCFQWSSPNLQVAANSRVWMRSIVSETLRRHTNGVPAQRPPSGVHTVSCIQRITLLQLAHSQPLSPSRDILLCRWCLRALALRHERQVLMCQCRHAPPASRHPRVLYLTCVFACLEGTRSTTGHDSRCASTASTPSTGLGDSTTSVVVRSS